jgi:hypothetical protein
MMLSQRNAIKHRCGKGVQGAGGRFSGTISVLGPPTDSVSGVDITIPALSAEFTNVVDRPAATNGEFLRSVKVITATRTMIAANIAMMAP